MKKQGPPPWGINQVGMRALAIAGLVVMTWILSDVTALRWRWTEWVSMAASRSLVERAVKSVKFGNQVGLKC